MEGHGDDGVDIEERYVEGEKEREREERETAHSWCPPEMSDERRSDWKRA